MTDSADHTAHGPADTRPYILIFVILCVFTAVSFGVNHFVQTQAISSGTGFVIILSVAVVKALCVVMIFMHVKWDWGRLYFLIIPALILAPMLVFALLPDLVIYWHNLPGWMTPVAK
jgi:caa(3)-type oxidase subunit IV